MKYLIKNRNFWIILGIDSCLLFLAYLISFFIRFEGEIPTSYLLLFKKTFWLIIPFKLLFFLLFKLYKGMWRYTSISDLLNIVKATITSSVFIILFIYVWQRIEGFPRSVFIIDSGLTLLFVGGSRLSIRMFLWRTSSFTDEQNSRVSFFDRMKESKRMLIIGAGDAGEKMLRELRDNPRLNYDIIGFLDDDAKKHGMHIHGVSILGDIDQMAELVKEYEIDELLIAISNVSGQEMRRIVECCGKTGLKFRTIPGIGELIDGRVSVKTIRDVAYEDLLGRKPVRLEMEKIGGYVKNKSILVTGAGGSVGSELCRQIAHFGPDPLILLDCGENNLYQIEMELWKDYPYLRIIPILGNVLNESLLARVFARYQPSVVFHAAAYKHVPIVELNPWEAIINNVQGTRSLLEVVKSFPVERFVFVSTDKAVRPMNVMGASKRVAELLVQGYGKVIRTRLMSVRFGNVIGSSGSVIPLFRKQIERGGPVTVTDPEVTRYFMTIPEAAQLILQAGAMGEGGETFILDMGTTIKIVDLARDLIRLSGLEPDRDIEIQFIGLRPGEKLYEELITEGEGIIPTHHEKILVLRGNSIDSVQLKKRVGELIRLADAQNVLGIKEKLKEIVPEYEIVANNSSGSIGSIYGNVF